MHGLNIHVEKSLKHLAQEIAVPKSSARSATQLLEIYTLQITLIHTFQLHNPANRLHFCSWLLQSVAEGEIKQQLTSLSDSVNSLARKHRHKTITTKHEHAK
jgi:hypothetical protein